ncbi:Protein kinase domain-containing protein [Entamoeba marina]
MGDADSDISTYFYAVSASVSPFIVGALFLNFLYLFLRMPFHAFMFHIHIPLFCGGFMLKTVIYFVHEFIQSFLFWTSQSLLFGGLSYALFSIIYIFFSQNPKKKYVNSVILPFAVFHFIFVVAMHSFCYSYARDIMLGYTTLYSIVIISLIITFLVIIRSFGSKRVVAFVWIILVMLVLTLIFDGIYAIVGIFKEYDGDYTTPLFDLINSTIICVLTCTLTDGLLFFRAFTGYKGVHIDEENPIITTDTSIDTTFLLHMKSKREYDYCTVGSAIFLGKKVIYKQVGLEHLYSLDSLADDLMKMKVINHPHIQKTEGMSITNLNVYVICGNNLLLNLDDVLQKSRQIRSSLCKKIL